MVYLHINRPFNRLRPDNQHPMWVDTGDAERPHGCNICNYKFGDKTKLIRHLNSVHISQRLKCQWCDWSTKRNDKLFEHAREKHNQNIAAKALNDIGETEEREFWQPSLMHLDFDSVNDQLLIE